MIKTPFYTGKAVTTDWLNSSQYFGPGNPGIIFVANPLNFWEYPLLNTQSIDVSDFDGRYITKQGNVTISGIKDFTNSPTAPTPAPGDTSFNLATTAFVAGEINNAITNGGFVDLTSAQIITGFKTFNAIKVPLNPGFADSPVALQYLDTNYVDVSTSGNIAGIKTFSNSPEVPTPTTGPAATPKSYVDGLISTVQTAITNLQVFAVAFQSLVTGLTVGTGNAGYVFFYIVFPGGLKFIWADNVGSAGAADTINFPTVGQGFPGFANAPTVFLTGNRNQGDCFAPQAVGITAVSFGRRNEVFGNNSVGGPTSFLAIGV
jgi:hypothetical protein